MVQGLPGERKGDRAGVLGRDAMWLPREKKEELQGSILLHPGWAPGLAQGHKQEAREQLGTAAENISLGHHSLTHSIHSPNIY